MNPWQENTDYPVRDWQYEVTNDDTRLGYQDWVDHKIESEGIDNADKHDN